MKKRFRITTFLITIVLAITLHNCQCGENNNIPEPTFDLSAQVDKSAITLKDNNDPTHYKVGFFHTFMKNLSKWN